MQERVLGICNQKGLHARAAAKFVKIAEQFDATIEVWKMPAEEGAGATASSILGLMMLGAECGSDIKLRAEGPQAEQALDALYHLVSGKFGESE